MKKFFIGVLLVLVILAGIELFIHKDGKEHVVKKDEQLVNGQSQAQAVYGDAASGLKVGTKAPNFTLQTLSGETISLSELAGKSNFEFLGNLVSAMPRRNACNGKGLRTI